MNDTPRGLTYHPEAPHSYFRDLILTQTGRQAGPDAEDRLAQHAKEMRVIDAEYATRASRALRAAGFEYRVEPNVTQGEGGYFAPPFWANELFATARRPKRQLADLISAHFPMIPGVSSINLPIIQNGSVVQPTSVVGAVPDQDITDAAGSSVVVTLSGEVDCALQLLEQSPPGAHVDWAFMMDLSESYDADLEGQLIYGGGKALQQILGVANVSGNNYVQYDDNSPTGSEMYPYIGQAFAEVGDNRDASPECWLMRSARWAWINTEQSTAQLPFGLPSPFFMGSDPDTPNPIGGLLGLPVFLDDAIPATITFGTPSATVIPNYGSLGGSQDMVLVLRPSDLILFEGNPQITVGNVYTDVLSGVLGVRIQLHDYAAAITNRYAQGISVLGGTGFAVASGF